MKLCPVPFRDGIKKARQVLFGGLNRSIGASDGELADMRNLTSDHFPVLATRLRRGMVNVEAIFTVDDVEDAFSPDDELDHEQGASPQPEQKITALFSHEKLCWVYGDGFYYDGIRKGDVLPGDKTIANLGVFIILFPDKAYYNTYTDEFGNMESSWHGEELTFTNCTIFEEEADANTIQADGVEWSDYFRVGDAVTVEGASVNPENNKTSIVREIDGDKLRFSEYAFKLSGEDGTEPYTETGGLSVSRTVPDLLFICESENRLWGCDETGIRTSVLGDPINFNVFDGTDMDAWGVDIGSPGPFTACTTFMGFPTFFKEDVFYQIYGTLPSNFHIMPCFNFGVARGCEKSLAVANETLYYLSRSGVMAYQGGGPPQPIGMAFGTERFGDASAGSDGLKYYISMRRMGVPKKWQFYVYDTLRNMWHIEDDTHAAYFTLWRGNVYFLNADGEIWCVMLRGAEAPDDILLEPDVEWRAEFADMVDNNPNRKGMTKFQIRLRLDPGAEVRVYIRYDSETEWQLVQSAAYREKKSSYYLPIIPRRVDHYRLKLEGTGQCEIYSLVRERSIGSELTSAAE